MSNASKAQGVRVRHLKSCPARNSDEECAGKCPWQAIVYDRRQHKTVPKTFTHAEGGKAAAVRWRRDLMSAIENNTAPTGTERSGRLADALREWLDLAERGVVANRKGGVYSSSSIASYRSTTEITLVPALGDWPVSELRRRDVQAFVDQLAGEGMHPRTISARLNPLKAYYRYALDRELVGVNPTREIRMPPVPFSEVEVVPYSDVERMLATLEPGAERALWATAFFAGLRKGELAALGRDDIDLATGVIRVWRGCDDYGRYNVTTKGKGARTVPIVPELHDVLAPYLAGVDHDDRIFGKNRWVKVAGKRACEHWRAAGLPEIGLHAARHTFASLALDSGMNLKELSSYLGHANIALTGNTYTHLMPGNEAQAADRMSAYFERKRSETRARRDTAPVSQTVSRVAETAT